MQSGLFSGCRNVEDAMQEAGPKYVIATEQTGSCQSFHLQCCSASHSWPSQEIKNQQRRGQGLLRRA